MRRMLLSSFIAVLVLLTFLLQRAGTPDEIRHERVLGALRTIDLMNASLQRDVLRARAGLLSDYDPLSAMSSTLDRQAELLASEVPELRTQTAALRSALEEQNDRLERFKTQNALVQNSRRVFERAVREIIGPGGGMADGAAEVIRLATSVLRLTSDPPSALPAEVMTAARHLATLPEAERYATLIAHARVIATALPAVNASLKALQEGPVVQPAQQFHEAYLQAYGRISARARMFRLALYSAAIALAAYTLFLVLRLERQARHLRQQLAVETLVAKTSSALLNQPQGKIGECIIPALAKIGEHFGIDRVRIILKDAPEGVNGHHEWARQNAAPGEAGMELMQLLDNWPLDEHGVAIVADVGRLQPGPARTLLRRLGLQSWMAVTIGPSQRSRGMLSLEDTAAAMTSSNRHAAALYTLANLFGGAFAREEAAAEQEALRTRLAHAERLEALGTLAGGIAHEFNNTLGSMLGHAELALGALRRSGAAHRYVSQILSSGGHAKAVVDQILTFSRAPAWRREPLRPQPVVQEALEMIRVSLPRDVTLSLAMDAPEAVISGDAVGLRQIVVNLGHNAAQAMGEEGVVKVSCSTALLPYATTLSHGELAAGTYFRLAVADTGSGIPPTLLARIFEPFFTTKGPGQGTGLGLAVVHGIVMGHGGALDVQSRLGEGTTFSVYLPLTEAEPVAPRRSVHCAVPKGAGEAILLVEPDQQQLLLAEEMVAALGYEPVGAGSAAAAWERLRAAPDDFNLVMAASGASPDDVVAFTRQVRDLRPELPIVLMAEEGDPGPWRRKRAGIAGIVSRPLQFRPLGELLNRYIARSPAPQAGDRP
ncbi:DAHL domain-containing protein [Roseomonas marmotae]|uniref:histidine kinase n=1 Tax=Roseomonas marmotae TaxID=2768161 RepID=A0ABS3K890_9PROT|nr:DAHL domain-containing protein [Roseomonas marmotae]MBO1073687.1 hypothetical protein [Roseomonas marmotae]QTI78671.1 hypothetical protein IAI58_13510 [Roseomonas marmotae]